MDEASSARSTHAPWGAPQAEIDDPDTLTIGFARRFATYKRATLILRDMDRLRRILTDQARPVQLIFAGKAHPQDEAGKELIRKITEFSRDSVMGRHVVFLEDYDMAVARAMVQGVDVWLNTPLRPNEASGTSGMKAAANAVLNMSVPDGWWDEVWNDPKNSRKMGWAIGQGESYGDLNYQDQVEAESLYDLLERDVVPAFYDRGNSPSVGRADEGIRGFAVSLRHHASHGARLCGRLLRKGSRSVPRAR
jgi:starch phosphorylase